MIVFVFLKMHYNKLLLPFKWVLRLFSKYKSLNLGLSKNERTKELIVVGEIGFWQRGPCRERLQSLKKIEECCRNDN